MIGRLNHVAIAVPDLDAAGRSTGTRLARLLVRHRMNQTTG